MNVDRANSLGECLDLSVESAMSAWRREYAPHVAVGDLLGNDVRAIRIASNKLPYGVLDVMVKVQARRAWQHEAYFWKWHIVAGEYRLV
jgi:hypothetical protein